MIKQILVPLDGSSLAEVALDAAGKIGKATSAKITLVHVLEKNPPASIHGQQHLRSEEDARNYLLKAARDHFHPDQTVEIHVHEEPVDRVAESITNHIIEFGSDLIVMCSHGNGGLRDALYGSIAQQVVAKRKAPVLILFPFEHTYQNPFVVQKILLPLDGNPEHEEGMKIAEELTRAFEAELTLFTVIPTLSELHGTQAAVGSYLPLSTSYLLDELENETERYLYAHIERMRKEGIKANGDILRGDPSEEVGRYATDHRYDLVVIGTHGKSGANAFWAGSKAAQIMVRLKTPVLLAPIMPEG